MVFTRNRHLLVDMLAYLIAGPAAHPWKEPVCTGMAYLLNHGAQFDRSVSKSPFAQHFFRVLRRVPADTDDSLCFMLFEDLVIFFRETTLRGTEIADGPHTQLLTVFETSGEWTPGDATLVSDWYWSILPCLTGRTGHGAEIRP